MRFSGKCTCAENESKVKVKLYNTASAAVGKANCLRLRIDLTPRFWAWGFLG
jgi:hypothetical protein